MTTPCRTGDRRRIESYTVVGETLDADRGVVRAADGASTDWADRLAVLLAEERPDGVLHYRRPARGRFRDRAGAEQLAVVRRYPPDLVSFSAGNADLLLAGGDPDAVAERTEEAVAELSAHAGTVLLFTGVDPRALPGLRHLRGRTATYTAHVRAIADRFHCPVVDLWSLRALQEHRAWEDGALCLSPAGHRQVAAQAARVLGLRSTASEGRLLREPGTSLSRLRRSGAEWLRDYHAPWLARPVPEPRPAGRRES
ncbi:GDSL-type esterase/lipase family protein [Streptomyces fumanus]|uniref:SGNH hydrolase n=1 Tax=Streptomyces fumanus TaxID=67302 RepID=A0A919AID5_9ACTN|nr:GDSL-type esterase/lipase family protein [Streptomyces fumanus]GHF08357.1 SGNH hydrolase [Streptomyces fumanus]